MVLRGLSLIKKLKIILIAVILLAILTIFLQYKFIKLGAFSLGLGSFDIIERIFPKSNP